MGSRNSDGTYRSSKVACQSTARSQIARWVEKMAEELVVLGFSFSKAAREIGRAARGETTSAVPLPAVAFPQGFRISTQAAYQAYRRASDREPKLTAKEWRELDYRRCEASRLAVQNKALAGDIKANDLLIRIQDHEASSNGYKAPTKVQVKAEVDPEEVRRQEDDEEDIEILRMMTPEESATVGRIMADARQRWEDNKRNGKKP